MALPNDLLLAVSASGGGKVALIVGAGCSVEPPTGIPTARECSTEVYRRLVDDGVLQDGDCPDPGDLSALTDVVVTKTRSQADVVVRLVDQFPLKLPTPNDGHLVAAAMLCEGAISSIVTLNFDLALSAALSVLGVETRVGVIEGPQDLPQQKVFNLYYIHRNANAADPETWVLRTAALEKEWKDTWQQIITTKVMITPVVVFAGLGTPVEVLVACAKLLRTAVPEAAKLYQVDPVPLAGSPFFAALAIDPGNYIQSGWIRFMEELSQRLVKVHIAQFDQAIKNKVEEDQVPIEDIAGLMTNLGTLGLVKLGYLRALWLLHDKPYHPGELEAARLVADLLLGLAMVARVSGAHPLIIEDGLVEFRRGDRLVAALFVVSGRGHRGKAAVEADVERRRKRYRGRWAPPQGVIVAGTSDGWINMPTPPSDILQGDAPDSIIAEQAPLPLYHVGAMRADAAQVKKVVP